MTDKDPKDMTASELLRWIANGEPNEYGTSVVHFKLFSALSGKPYDDTTEVEDAQNIRALAARIDAEIEAARRDAVKESKKPMRWFRSAIRQGEDWPEPRDGEKFREYLRRCFILLPRFEDGEPVRFGEDTDKLHEVEKLIFTRSGECCQMQDARGNMQNAFPGQRVKRPGPEMLGADGKPISVGETVYSKNTGSVYTVLKVKPLADLVTVGIYNGIAFDVNHASLTHTPPGTQDRIDEDARKDVAEYWDCLGVTCDSCPVKIDGKTPKQRYNTPDCATAKALDLLRRQRELDARKGGAE